MANTTVHEDLRRNSNRSKGERSSNHHHGQAVVNPIDRGVQLFRVPRAFHALCIANLRHKTSFVASLDSILNIQHLIYIQISFLHQIRGRESELKVKIARILRRVCVYQFKRAFNLAIPVPSFLFSFTYSFFYAIFWINIVCYVKF